MTTGSWHSPPRNPTGSVVQIVNTTSDAVATGTTTIPNDDTIPQITEGTEFMTLAITPKSTTNILVIEVFAMLANSAVAIVTGGLFQGATANALAGVQDTANLVGAPFVMVIRHVMLAGTTASTTFRFRAGPESASTTTFNGIAGGRKLGAITKSSMLITEYKA